MVMNRMISFHFQKNQVQVQKKSLHFQFQKNLGMKFFQVKNNFLNLLQVIQKQQRMINHLSTKSQGMMSQVIYPL